MKIRPSIRNALKITVAAAALTGLAVAVAAPLASAPVPHAVEKPAKMAWAPAVTPAPLSPAAKKGLDWLVGAQLADGGWGQGEESQRMGRGMAHHAGQSNVADSGMAILALLRSGSTPTNGAFQKPINRGVDFILGQIEASDADSLWITSVRGTRVQGKIGPYVGTFISAQLLAEVDGKMGSDKRNARVREALDKVLAKMDRNQRDDGGYAGQAWAPALSQAIAVKGTNRAAQAGAEVSKRMKDRSESWAKTRFDATTEGFSAGGDSAGIALYGAAASVGGMADAVNTNAMEEAEIKAQYQAADSPAAKAEMAKELDRIADTRAQSEAAQQALTRRLDDPSFVSGFGSNGGEEFLSYMLVAESLVVKGGDEWARWNAAMQNNLSRVQNKDGSWTGHHCITGRTFCTAAALLVLMADRAPVPLASQINKRG